MGAAYNYDHDYAVEQVKWNKDFALDFDEVVPLFYTNILLVEDDPMTSAFIKGAMKKIMGNNIRVRSFSSAEKSGEYILSLKRHHLPGPDIAIVDYLLSGEIDGLWICKLLENEFPETQTVLISSLPAERIKREMEEHQTKPIFLPKPFEAASLKSLIA